MFQNGCPFQKQSFIFWDYLVSDIDMKHFLMIFVYIFWSGGSKFKSRKYGQF